MFLLVVGFCAGGTILVHLRAFWLAVDQVVQLEGRLRTESVIRGSPRSELDAQAERLRASVDGSASGAA